mmetsp:Transcript_7653/g.16471  ORF Transcript_7653/g.16471 Transcript_7653/m.16471 type:complete len:234 (-) Transcript_7653:151-852(-)
MNLVEFARMLAFNVTNLGSCWILVHTLSVAHCSKDVRGVSDLRIDQCLLNFLVNRSLNSGHKSRSHIDTLSSQRESRSQLPPSCAAPGSDKRDFKLLRSLRKQTPIANILLPGVASAIETVHRDHVGTHSGRGLGVPHGNALVNHDDASCFQGLNHNVRLAPCCLHHLDSLFDHDSNNSLEIRLNTHRQQRDIDSKRFVCELLALANLVSQRLSPFRRLSNSECSNDSETTGV